MPVRRRDFMKLFGISLGSVLLARCQREKPVPTTITCYAPTAAPISPTFLPASARDRLRRCWLRFGELVQAIREKAEKGEGGDGDPLGDRMMAEHRKALDDLVGESVLTPAVADLIQEAFSAAVYHIWRSNAPITCYDMADVDYAPVSAESLVNQSEALEQLAADGTIPSETLAKARAALERDLAYYALTDEEVRELNDRILKEYALQGKTLPSFDDLSFTLTPDVESATQFLLDLLTGK